MSRSGDRLLTVLDALQAAGGSLNAAEVARRTGLSDPTAWRMLQSLVEWGGVERLSDGSYRIATRLWAVGSSAPCVRRLQRDTFFHLRTLAERTRAEAVLAVFDGRDAIIVSSTSERAGWREGDRVTMAGTAVGEVFSSARDLTPPASTGACAVSVSDGVAAVAVALTDPSGATVGAVALQGGDRRGMSRALHDALPRIRFSVYREELLA